MVSMVTLSNMGVGNRPMLVNFVCDVTLRHDAVIEAIVISQSLGTGVGSANAGQLKTNSTFTKVYAIGIIIFV